MIQYITLGFLLLAVAQLSVNGQKISSSETNSGLAQGESTADFDESLQNTDQSPQQQSMHLDQLARLNYLNYMLKQEFLKKLKSTNNQYETDQMANDEFNSIEQMGELLRSLKLKRVSLRDVASSKRSNKRGTHFKHRLSKIEKKNFNLF